MVGLYALDLASGDARVGIQDRCGGGILATGPGVTAFMSALRTAILYALDAVSGELQWKYETGDKILGAPNWVKAPGDRGHLDPCRQLRFQTALC
jgi:outer membrane protein assembly factor BamB